MSPGFEMYYLAIIYDAQTKGCRYIMLLEAGLRNLSEEGIWKQYKPEDLASRHIRYMTKQIKVYDT